MKLKALLPALFVCTSAPLADVLVVDALGAGHHTTLSAAVAAAMDGDVILIRPGTYVESDKVVIDDKSLTIAGEPLTSPFGASATLSPGLIVRNLGPGRNVVLQNLLVYGAPGTAATGQATSALVLVSNQGHVRVQDSWVFGGGGGDNAQPHGASGLRVTGCATTALVQTIVEGGPGQFSPDLSTITGDGGEGVRLFGSELAIYGGWVQGGSGGGNLIGGWPQGGRGGVGTTASNSTLLLSGVSVEGGGGGTAHNGGDGGDGLVIGPGGSALLMAGSYTNGGDGGWSDAGPDGMDGLPLIDPLGMATDLGGTYHDFGVTSPVREGQAALLDFSGHTTDSILLFFAPGVQPDPFSIFQGTLLLSTAGLSTLSLGGPGNLNLSFAMPMLPTGIEALEIHLQPAYLGSDGVFLGLARVVTLVDAAF